MCKTMPSCLWKWWLRGSARRQTFLFSYHVDWPVSAAFSAATEVMLFEILSFSLVAWDQLKKSLLISGSWVFYRPFSRDKLTNITMHVDGDRDSTSHMVTHLHHEMSIWFRLSYQLQAWKKCRHTFVTFMPYIIVSFHLTISKLNSSAIYILPDIDSFLQWNTSFDLLLATQFLLVVVTHRWIDSFDKNDWRENIYSKLSLKHKSGNRLVGAGDMVSLVTPSCDAHKDISCGWARTPCAALAAQCHKHCLQEWGSVFLLGVFL